MAVVQRVVKDIGDAFTDVEKQFLNHSFQLSLVMILTRTTLVVSRSPVKHAGMALPDLASAKSNYEASTLVNVHLLAALKGNEEFHSADHKAISREVRSELKVRKKAKDDSG
jgi:hypothetical protein